MTPSSPLLSAADLADIQGFVTSGYGHLPHSGYLFLQIEDRANARRWLDGMIPHVTTAAPWPKLPNGEKLKPQRTLNLAFTAKGLRRLGLPEISRETFPPEFLQGMDSEERSRILGDTGGSASDHWQMGGPNNGPVHALAILAATTGEALAVELENARKRLHDFPGITVVAEERGAIPEHGREPFGFRDGMAQPEIKGLRGDGVNTGEFILGYENEYGFPPVSPLLGAADDPQGILADSANPHHPGLRDFGLNGTFVVYRKLEQDVAGFWRFLQSESGRWRGRADPQFMVWLAAKMVGRWPGGAPLALAPDLDEPALSEADDFLYAASDPDGLRCPFGAHIRRTNPRDQIRPAGPAESLHMTARHRILRRGRPYGRDLFELSALNDPGHPEAIRAIVDLQGDGQARGIHFLCVNASIKSQFEFVQQAWANNPHFNGVSHNRDPLIGPNDDPDDGTSMHVPRADHPPLTEITCRVI
jgi:Dyp-type peroxidase family